MSDREALDAIVKVLGIGGEGRPPCTGVSARWCPNHGDCACPDPECDMSDPGCPLHAPSSDHAEEGEPFEFDSSIHGSQRAEDMAERLNKIADIVRAHLAETRQ